MHEHIFPGLALNESKTFTAVKPLHYTLFSTQLLYFLLFDRINFYSENFYFGLA